ncbi:hypothetical protein D3C86_1665190 [compost metagenome]
MLARPAKLLVDTNPRRAMYLKLAGNWAQKAGSSAISSRTATTPMSARAAVTSATPASTAAGLSPRTAMVM